MWSRIVLTSKRHFLARKHVVWAITRENRSSRSTWAQDREQKQGQDSTGQNRTVQKSYKVVIFYLFGEKSRATVPTDSKICMVGKLGDVITCAKFQDEIFRGYDFTGGRISPFPIDFRMGLTTAALLHCLWLTREFTMLIRRWQRRRCFQRQSKELYRWCPPKTRRRDRLECNTVQYNIQFSDIPKHAVSKWTKLIKGKNND